MKNIRIYGNVIDKINASPFLTGDQVERLCIDDVASQNVLNFKDFDFSPSAVEDTLIRFIRTHRPMEFQRMAYEGLSKSYHEKQ